MKKVLANVLMNLVMMAGAVVLSNLALAKNFEETLVLVVLIYGLAVVIANAIFIRMATLR